MTAAMAHPDVCSSLYEQSTKAHRTTPGRSFVQGDSEVACLSAARTWPSMKMFRWRGQAKTTRIDGGLRLSYPHLVRNSRVIRKVALILI